MLTTSEVSIKSLGEGLQVQASARGFHIVFDEPVDMGGTDAGMNPIEGLLCALGGCQAIAMKIFAQSQSVALEDIEMRIEGDIDPEGFMGNPNIPNGLQDVRMVVRLKCADAEAAKALADLAEERCPVGNCLTGIVPVVRTELEIV